MESWMIIVLIIGAIIMATVWMLRIVGDRELKKQNSSTNAQGYVKGYYVDKNQPDERLADWSPRNADDEDNNARYDSNGRRIN